MKGCEVRPVITSFVHPSSDLPSSSCRARHTESWGAFAFYIVVRRYLRVMQCVPVAYMQKPSEACTAGQRASCGNHREPQRNKTYNQKGIAIQSFITLVRFILRFFFFSCQSFVQSVIVVRLPRFLLFVFVLLFCLLYDRVIVASPKWRNMLIICIHVVSCLSVSWTDSTYLPEVYSRIVLRWVCVSR